MKNYSLADDSDRITTVDYRYQVTLVDGRDGSSFDSKWASSREEAFQMGANWIRKERINDKVNAPIFCMEVFDRMARKGKPCTWRYTECHGQLWTATREKL